MALQVADRVQVTSTSYTTSSFTLGSALTGFQGFTALTSGNTTYYAATDTVGNWEVGYGTYTTGALARTTILSSSNSGSVVTFSGTVNIFITYPAEKVVIQDANGNVSGNSFTPGWTSTTTAAGTTTFTVASTYYQRFVGSTTQTVKLPDATTVAKGQGFIIDNDSLGSLSLQDGSSASLGSVVAGMAAFIFCEDNNTTAGSWSGYMFVPGSGPSGQVTWGTAGLSMGGQAITNANWNGTAVPILYGGTNASTASITSFNNITGYSAAGATGTTSTNLVFSTSPTLVTPTLGAALATSIKFGSGTVLSDYEEGTWTPTLVADGTNFTSVTYDSNTGGRYVKVGKLVHVQCWLKTNAITVGSAAGNLTVAGLPFAVTASSGSTNDGQSNAAIGYSASFTSVQPTSITVQANSTVVYLWTRTNNASNPSTLVVANAGTGSGSNYVTFTATYVST